MQAAAYEACRVFRDRLVHSDHTARFDSILADTLRKHWRVNLDMTSSVFATIGSPVLQSKSGEGHVGCRFAAACSRLAAASSCGSQPPSCRVDLTPSVLRNCGSSVLDTCQSGAAMCEPLHLAKVFQCLPCILCCCCGCTAQDQCMYPVTMAYTV